MLILIGACLAVADVWLLHCRLGGALAVRLARLRAVSKVVQIRNARVMCCETDCRLFAEAAGVSVTPTGSNGVSFEIGRIRACNSETQFEGFAMRDASKRILVSATGGRLGLAGVPLAVRIEGITFGSKPVLATVGSIDLRATIGDQANRDRPEFGSQYTRR